MGCFLKKVWTKIKRMDLVIDGDASIERSREKTKEREKWID